MNSKYAVEKQLDGNGIIVDNVLIVKEYDEKIVKFSGSELKLKEQTITNEIEKLKLELKRIKYMLNKVETI
jgi:hypothetical protein